ncbi:DgyrCDS758 [Dimorphilus gyrociliatus]|uniref:DgyrCDS758 n=1 Tax=Dimorphilus gyrociliatus TaxID=2664684 RepID=A0A7I8V5B0_9ANNE|nr:DgyrCDS758 [Dimorphilus gyrociliatus]
MAPTTEIQDERVNSKTIIVNQSKREMFSLQSGLKNLNKKLRSNWKLVANREDLQENRLRDGKLLIIPAPRDKFSMTEFDALKSYINGGGSILVLMTEGGETKLETNINFFLEEFGIMVNNDAVVRTHYYKYYHPKEALVSNGILNRAISQAAGKAISADDESNNSQQKSRKKKGANLADFELDEIFHKALSFVYPYGSTLNVIKPSHAVLSSGSVTFPLNRPVCAFYPGKNGKGKIAVLGSVHMFTDQYLEKEENAKILDVIINYLTTDEVVLNNIDAEDPEISDYNQQPDTTILGDQVKACLQETEDIPRDITTLFDKTLFSLDTSLVPKTIRAYKELNTKHEALSLITPQFETPLPPLNPAVYHPQFREPVPPNLDLFDLDEQFSTDKVRLAQVTNKCGEEDLEYYVRECGEILGVTQVLPLERRSAKNILEYVLNQVVEFKKLNQDHMDESQQHHNHVHFSDNTGQSDMAFYNNE